MLGLMEGERLGLRDGDIEADGDFDGLRLGLFDGDALAEGKSVMKLRVSDHGPQVLLPPGSFARTRQ